VRRKGRFAQAPARQVARGFASCRREGVDSAHGRRLERRRRLFWHIGDAATLPRRAEMVKPTVPRGRVREAERDVSAVMTGAVGHHQAKP